MFPFLLAQTEISSLEISNSVHGGVEYLAHSFVRRMLSLSIYKALGYPIGHIRFAGMDNTIDHVLDHNWLFKLLIVKNRLITLNEFTWNAKSIVKGTPLRCCYTFYKLFVLHTNWIVHQRNVAYICELCSIFRTSLSLVNLTQPSRLLPAASVRHQLSFAIYR